MKLSMLVALLSAVLAVAACQRSADAPKPNVGGNAATLPATSNPGTSSAETKDPSMPASTAPDAMPKTSEAQKKANPQGEMTKQEESTAMPKPSQANDHSSTALDEKKK